jgi:uncharacterized membrane protein YqhA
MPRLLAGTRYLVLIPIVGLALAAAVFFVIGGIGLIHMLAVTTLVYFGAMTEVVHEGRLPVAIEIVEYVHHFLIGTVLYITAAGLYQLFIHPIRFPRWLTIESTEELETNLIGVTVVVLAVNFLSVVYRDTAEGLLEYGVGISLPIAALALFVGLRTWSTHLTASHEDPNEDSRPSDE